MAVSIYNDGKTTLTSVLKELGILPGYYTEYGYWKQDHIGAVLAAAIG